MEKEKRELKLYVFEDYCPDYTGGLAFAIATGEKDAKRLIENKRGLRVYDWGSMSVYPLTKKVAFQVSGGS